MDIMKTFFPEYNGKCIVLNNHTDINNQLLFLLNKEGLSKGIWEPNPEKCLLNDCIHVERVCIGSPVKIDLHGGTELYFSFNKEMYKSDGHRWPSALEQHSK